MEKIGKKVDAQITTKWDEAEDAHRDFRERGFRWDDREELFYGRYKSSKEPTKSVYSTGELQNMVIDSACRVMAQMPTGRFTSINEAQFSDVIAANLTYHHYFLPNANTGGDFFTKMRQVNIYSKVYGTMPTFVDWVISDKYTGPDPLLVHPRRFRPQPGKYVIDDMDYCFVETSVSMKWLKKRQKKSPQNWNLEGVKESDLDIGSQTVEEQNLAKKSKGVVLRHYLTREGDWIIYNPASEVEVARLEKYFPCMPMVDKQTIPLLDRYFGLCEYDRGETPQKTLDTMMRLFLDGWSYDNEPPLIIDPEEVVMSSILRQPKAKWLVKNKNMDAIKPADVRPRALGNFQTAYNMVKANLLSLSAQTDTAVARSVDVGFGKTPEALRQQAEKEGARDSWDRYMQERYMEKLATMMLRVAAHKGIKEVKIPNIQAALDKIRSAYPEDELSLFSSGSFKGNLLSSDGLRYEIDPGSTMKRDDTGQIVMTILSNVVRNPKIEQSLMESGKKINWGEALKRVAIDNGVQDWDKIVVDATSPQSVAGVGDPESTTTETPPVDPAQTLADQGQAGPTPEEIAALAQTL